MAKPLVIVESPAKAKTIAKFLGDAFDVRASVGHVADLPSKGLQIDVENGFKPTYELTLRGKDVVKDLKALMKNASEDGAQAIAAALQRLTAGGKENMGSLFKVLGISHPSIETLAALSDYDPANGASRP